MKMMQGDRISLRPIEKKDLPVLNSWKNNEEVYRYLGGGYMPVSIDIQESWMDSIMETTGGNKRFIIEDKNKRSVGMAGLYNINWIHRICEFGVFVGDVSEQGKGYGSEAYVLMEYFAGRYLNLRKIKVFVVKENSAAVNMYQKLGFKTAGELLDERFINGKYCSVLLLEKMLSRGGTSLAYFYAVSPLDVDCGGEAA